MRSMAAAAGDPDRQATHPQPGSGQGRAALPRTTTLGQPPGCDPGRGGALCMAARVVRARYRAAMSTFTWRFEAADGSALTPPEDPGPFSSKADAESWVGESWRDLLAHGVEQVSLLRDGELVYPMSLRPLE
jgi:hypothetical protein